MLLDIATSDPAASNAATVSSPTTRYEGVKAQGGRHGVITADVKISLERVMNDDPLAQEGLLNFWNEATRGLADEFGVWERGDRQHLGSNVGILKAANWPVE
jgi:hypothetical protein